jgi:hypothetical protein
MDGRIKLWVWERHCRNAAATVRNNDSTMESMNRGSDSNRTNQSHECFSFVEYVEYEVTAPVQRERIANSGWDCAVVMLSAVAFTYTDRTHSRDGSAWNN